VLYLLVGLILGFIIGGLVGYIACLWTTAELIRRGRLIREEDLDKVIKDENSI